jgi:hypothetical protein
MLPYSDGHHQHPPSFRKRSFDIKCSIRRASQETEGFGRMKSLQYVNNKTYICVHKLQPGSHKNLVGGAHLSNRRLLIITQSNTGLDAHTH